MGRKESVYNTLHSLSQKIRLEKFKGKDRVGFNVYDLEAILGIDRTNISRILNTLFREGSVIKVIGKPVLFISKQAVEELLNMQLSDNVLEVSNQCEIIENHNREDYVVDYEEPDKDVFQDLIGYDKSLKKQIEQAKAAITYPPYGLTTLLLGQTGVGKTLFASMMYKFAVHLGKRRENSQFVVFNCADYSYNPQLIVAQLFGYTQGAFTGADQEKSGLVEKADGGVLFLDEVHRLPPEAQEMLFYLMDHGIYRRLGEIESTRKARPFIIAATTEEPSSNLLNTFMRRIPVSIRLPSLDARGLDERFSLIKQIFKQEANVIDKVLVLSSQVIKYFLTYECKGNIGQLKGDIKLVCARAYMRTLAENERKLIIDSNILMESFDEDKIKLRHYTKRLGNIYIQDPTIIKPSEKSIDFDTPMEFETSIYKFIKNQLYTYSEEAVQEKKNDPINMVKNYFASFLDYYKGNEKDQREKLLHFVDEKIIEVIRKFLEIALTKYKLNIDFYYVTPLTMHINAIIQQLNRNIKIQGKLLDEKDAAGLSLYLELSQELTALLEKDLGVNIPQGEVIVLALLIKNIIEDEKKHGTVPILVMAHGDGVASSISNVANYLIGNVCVYHIDMPFEEKWEMVFNKAIELCKKIHSNEGILLFIDMGSLYNIGVEITKATGIPIKVVSYANTLLVLEAAQKSYYGKMTLNELFYEIQKIKRDMYYSEDLQVLQNDNFDEDDLYIVTICMTGSGTAVKLKEMLEEQFLFGTEVKIKAIDVNTIDNLEQGIVDLCEGHKPLAVIGTIRPKHLNSHFISLEEVIFGQGLVWIEKLLMKYGVFAKRVKPFNEKRGNNSNIMDFNNAAMISVIKNYLYYLDPGKTLENVLIAIERIEDNFSEDLTRNTCTNLIVHICCMLERLLFSDKNEKTVYDEKIIPHASYLNDPIKELGYKYKVEIPFEEKKAIHEIIRYGMQATND
ncbi:sigma-54-dependent transcriptional regulator [Propionispora vibrioides]|uniref:Transcriptional regulator containing an AAA-type ATPase domain and a DNA-binding domain n=1 Tax=Propionispora vibrioides TaxID=112903 RepID=A0A1H8T871_9FIRM|nr:sigma 54-interacting transcriptional regulator [Propionispora vibrioides]SEO86734.1 Transcriptional regulator containing an AAA-type ATPase domain and a DNA-binding domain [Propionispora vibrioides]